MPIAFSEAVIKDPARVFVRFDSPDEVALPAVPATVAFRLGLAADEPMAVGVEVRVGFCGMQDGEITWSAAAAKTF